MPAGYLIHGFNVSDHGRSTVRRMEPYLRESGYGPQVVGYGWLGMIGVRIQNPRIAKTIAESVQEGDIGVGHSNGCTILALAADAGAPFTGLILINPALPVHRHFAHGLKWVHVYYSTGDLAVAAAMALRILPWNWGGQQWGDMGRRGYTGSDKRVQSFNTGDHRHSDIFAKLDLWGPRMMRNAEIGVSAKGDGPLIEGPLPEGIGE